MTIYLPSQLRSYLQQKGFTLSDLARHSSVPKQSISGWLNGKVPRAIPQLKKVALSLGVSLDQLCFGDESGSVDSHKGIPAACMLPPPENNDVFGVLHFNDTLSQLTAPWVDLLGWSCIELTSGPAIEFVHRADRQRYRLQLSRCAGDGLPTFSDYRYLCKDGGIRWVRLSLLPIRDGGFAYCNVQDLGHEYLAESDVICRIPLHIILLEAIAVAAASSVFSDIDFRPPRPLARGVDIECSLARMSMAILALTHKAAIAALTSSGLACVNFALTYDEKTVLLDISVPGARSLPELSISRRVLREHHGNVDLAQEDGQIRFLMTLPRWQTLEKIGPS